MKKIEYIGILFLFGLSLFYTDKISNIAKNNDPIMKSIIEIHDNNIIESVNAIINENEIIPGKSGCEVDINKSYRNMKEINYYNKSMIKYKDIIPEITINNIYDKYITSGNKSKKEIAIVVYIKENLEKLKELNDIKINVFINSNLINNIKVNGNEKIYNGGNNLKYDNETIEFTNDLIESNYNKSNYCLNLDKNENNLLVCSKNKMHSITPKVIVKDIYNSKKEINNGSIIYFSEENIDKIKLIYDYLIKKGFNILYLDELLDEKGC